ncbi:SusE domain-containing protein [Neptunitalea lumnitzerae]|uniref:SusE outer membrane protein domain-containing protein n=1 Tax=Neptunitalea lumnitzerae TaxID=2965509 RepID=A0ABQ5MGM0_9FLAO|nr:SusE domain-containing protein [Neptunitalea sp. Y10]GLB48539.1 hypothetical protein Y10_09070 [Neptunitalea sp. Y10]
MKKIKFISAFILSIFLLNACIDDEDNFSFVAAPDTAGQFEFTNSFLSEYTLTQETSSNIGERFTWETPDFDVQTPVEFELQKSIIGDFTDAESVITNISGNEAVVTIGNLMSYAAEAGLDNDPDTDAPDAGYIYFRVRAYVGEPTETTEMISTSQALYVTLPAPVDTGAPVCDLDQLWLVGAGVPDAGWGWSTPVALPCSGDGIYSGNVRFQNTVDNNNFRFFTVEGDWNSGQNFPYYSTTEGYTIDANFVDAGDGDNNFGFVGANGTYLLTVNTVDKVITLSAPAPSEGCDNEQLYLVGAGVPDAGWGWDNLVTISCLGDGVYGGPVTFQSTTDANNFRFFTVEGDWGSGLNYPYYETAGYTIDANFANAADGDSNFAFIGTDGTYYLTIDTVNLTITLE